LNVLCKDILNGFEVMAANPLVGETAQFPLQLLGLEKLLALNRLRIRRFSTLRTAYLSSSRSAMAEIAQLLSLLEPELRW